MTEFIHDSEHVHAHSLKWNKKREVYNCEACKEKGHGPSYDCNQCKLKFHADCAIAPATLRHPFFPTTYVHHITAAAAGCSNQPKKCTACCSTIQGAAYVSKTSYVYFHPCCAMMPICVQKLNMVLIREAPSDPGTKACCICNGAFDSRWVYFFPAIDRHAHASCVMHEQGHAMNLVDSNLPFDNPDPVNNNIDGQMRLLNMAMDNMDPPTFTPHPRGPQELQSRSVPPSEGSRNYSARWVPMQHPAGPQNHGVPYLHGHGHGHGLPNWNSSAHAVQPGVGFDWPAPQNYWAQATLLGMSAGSIAPMMPPPPFNVAYTGSSWGSAPYAWMPPAPLPYYPHGGAGWNSTTQVPPVGGQAPYAWPPPAHLPYYPHGGAGWNSTTQVPPAGGQAPYAWPPQNNAAGNSIWDMISKWGFKLSMFGMGIADLVTD